MITTTKPHKSDDVKMTYENDKVKCIVRFATLFMVNLLRIRFEGWERYIV